MAREGMKCGAGRPGRHVKAEHCLRLHVRDLARRKLLGGRCFVWRWSDGDTGKELTAIIIATGNGLALLNCSHSGQPINEAVRITATPRQLRRRAAVVPVPALQREGGGAFLARRPLHVPALRPGGLCLPGP